MNKRTEIKLRKLIRESIRKQLNETTIQSRDKIIDMFYRLGGFDDEFPSDIYRNFKQVEKEYGSDIDKIVKLVKSDDFEEVYKIMGYTNKKKQEQIKNYLLGKSKTF